MCLFSVLTPRVMPALSRGDGVFLIRSAAGTTSAL